MGSIQATPRNAIVGRLADLLQSGKSYANKYEVLPQVPLLGGTGLGDLFMGKAPELVDDISYDGLQAAIRGGNVATGGIGTYGARPAVADAALLGADMVGIGKGLSGLSRKSASALYDKLIEGGTSISRREAIKKLGALSGGAAITGSGVGLVRKLADNTIADVAHVAPSVVDNVAVAAAKKYKFNTLAAYLNEVRMLSDQHMWDNFDPPNVTSYEGSPDYLDDVAKWDQRSNYQTQKILQDHANFYKQYKSDVANGLEPTPWSVEHNPNTNQFESIYPDEILSPQAKQELKEYKRSIARMNDPDMLSNFGTSKYNGEVSWSDPSEMKSYIDNEIPF